MRKKIFETMGIFRGCNEEKWAFTAHFLTRINITGRTPRTPPTTRDIPNQVQGATTEFARDCLNTNYTNDTNAMNRASDTFGLFVRFVVKTNNPSAIFEHELHELNE